MIRYTLKRSKRARAMRLEVRPDGNVVLTAPYFYGLAAIERFLLRNSQWVRRKVEETKETTVIRIQRGDISSLKRAAHELVLARGSTFAALYGVNFKKISIRAQKTRWGSCSENGDLSFNYKIATLPTRLADYIIVHEICHLIHFDHSRAFWSEVARTVPDHKEARKQLRKVAFIFA